MSELKVYRDQEDYIAYDDYLLEAYDKSEADKYIGELKKERDWLAKDRSLAYSDLEKRAQLNIKQEEAIRHQKYKRCMAMAKMCSEQADHYRAEYDAEEGFGDGWLKWIRWSKKWSTRWLKLADKFKEEK